MKVDGEACDGLQNELTSWADPRLRWRVSSAFLRRTFPVADSHTYSSSWKILELTGIYRDCDKH